MIVCPSTPFAGMTVEEVAGYNKHKNLATTGDSLAEFELGNCYFFGKGVVRDEARGILYFNKSAEKGYVQAQIFLGNVFFCTLPKQDFKKSFYWFSKAAEQGNPDAQRMLALLYRLGMGTETSYALANHWDHKAAEQGDTESAYSLGLAYLFGRGIDTNKSKAAYWFKRAADQGNEQSQYELAKLYAKGDGIPKDEIEAYAYYNLANGIPDARSSLSQLESIMSSDARLVAQQRTKELQKIIEGRLENIDDLKKAVEKEKQRKGA